MKYSNLSFRASLNGEVNGKEIILQGEGTINDGHTDGKYDLIQLPEGFSPEILSVVLVTGYPNASETIDQTQNIFKGNSYNYTRHIKFSDGGELQLQTECVLEGNHLDSKFTLHGEINDIDLVAIQPIVESWEPCGEGKIKGRFTATWEKQSTGEVITASTESDYIIDTEETQKNLCHRFIKIQNTYDERQLRKLQDVYLFTDLMKVI